MGGQYALRVGGQQGLDAGDLTSCPVGRPYGRFARAFRLLREPLMCTIDVGMVAVGACGGLGRALGVSVRSAGAWFLFSYRRACRKIVT